MAAWKFFTNDLIYMLMILVLSTTTAATQTDETDNFDKMLGYTLAALSTWTLEEMVFRTWLDDRLA